MMRVLALALALAGCDRVFGLDESNHVADASADGPSLPTPLVYFSFDDGFQAQIGGVTATPAGYAGAGGAIQSTGGARNGYVQIPAAGCLAFDFVNQPTTFTISMWVNTMVPASGFVSVLARPDMPLNVGTGGNDWAFTVDNAKVAFIVGASESVDDALGAGWHHLAVALDTAEVAVYADGSRKVYSAVTPYYGGGTQVFLGCDPFRLSTSAGNPFAGGIDEVRIYDVALTSDQLATL